MARPDERRFVLFRRGEVRDKIILARMRAGLRLLINPATNVVFSEDEVARATQPGSRYYIEADAIDLYGQGAQQRASWFADQIFPSKASSSYLREVHQPLWLPEGYLGAAGGLGEVTARAPAGTIWTGSTTLPDAGARIGRDAAGNRYQVYVTEATPANGIVELTVRAVDGGSATNLEAGDIITWENPPSGAEAEATVIADFQGGTNAETDQEFAQRVEEAMRFRPGAGNRSHFRMWARSASSAVEAGYIYACGLHAGAVVVCIIQKRTGTDSGPNAKIATLGTLTDASAYLVPPASPVVPGNVHVLVVPAVAQPSDLSIRLGLARGTVGGWADRLPWPSASATHPKITIASVSSATIFRIATDVAPSFALPGVAQLMVWKEATSRFEKLSVLSVAFISGTTYEVTLSAAPSVALATGQVISPYTDRASVIDRSVEAHFDTLGPGELVDLTTDVRSARAYRFPRASQEAPNKLGFRVISSLLDDLGGAGSDGDLFDATVTSPSVPTSVTDGPSKLTLGKLGVYDVEN